MTLINCDIGDSVLVTGTLKDSTGAAVIGATVTAKAIKGDGTQITLGACTDEGNGAYSILVDPDQSGPWQVRFAAASPTLAAAEGTIFVRGSRFV